MPTPRKTSPQPEAPKFRLKIFVVGVAGCNALTHVAAANLTGVGLVAVNTDLQTLNGVMVGERIQIGSPVTHGLGAGGDSEVGGRAAVQDSERLEAAMHGVD